MNGGRFEFDDGGSYCGGWEEAKAHGHGVCTGPQGKGEYAGAWHYGFEVSGVYTWPSGNTYMGQWQNGKRHGLGVEQRGRWVYRGDWTSGSKGRYGVRHSTTSQAKYAGTWSANYHDGYGTETYVDGGTYQGQWLRGMRHGFGVRKSAMYAVAARIRKAHNHVSLTSLRSGQMDAEDEENKEGRDGRGGFVLKANSRAPARRRRSLSERSLAVKRTILSGLRIKKQHSTGDIHQKVTSMTGSLRSSGSTMSCASDDSHKADGTEEETLDDNVSEIYHGEWKNDSRCGFGVCERSDGLKYHGEWANNMKNGYGVTTHKDGAREEGKYKNNVLIMSTRKKGVLFVRSSKLRERVEASVDAAIRSADIARQKADIAATRTSTAKERSENAVHVARQAKDDADMARIHAKQFDPSFKQPGTDAIRRNLDSGLNDSPRTDFSDRSSNPSKPSSFDMTLDAPDPGTYANHVGPSSSRLSHPANLAHQTSVQPGVMHGMNPGQHGGQHQMGPYPTVAIPHPSGIPVPVHPLGMHPVHPSMHPPGVHPVHHSASHPAIPSTNNSYLESDMAQATPLLSANSQPYANQISMAQQQQQQFSAALNQPYPSPQPSQYSYQTNRPDAATFANQNQSVPYPNQNRQEPVQQKENRPETASPPAPSNTPSLSPPSSRMEHHGSRFSLSDDHYDQYVMNQSRRRDGMKRELSNGGTNLNRRCTLASSYDRRLDQTGEEMGSLPNIAQLEQTGVRLRREEAARLASDRRQAVVREEEQRASLRANPLRYLLHPEFRAFFIRWKVLILLIAANLTLLFVFFTVFSYPKKPPR